MIIESSFRRRDRTGMTVCETGVPSTEGTSSMQQNDAVLQDQRDIKENQGDIKEDSKKVL
jgi:hypothetical protein